jgi:aminopeptidase N
MVSCVVGLLYLGGAFKTPGVEGDELICRNGEALFAAAGSPGHRQYAPDREIDILNLALDVTPDFTKRTVAGQAVLRFQPIAKPLSELKLDAVDLNVQSVTATEKILGFQNTDQKLIVSFAEPIPAGRETSVSIVYSAEPKRGLYFRTPEMGYKQGDTHLFTQGEAIEARHWYPCYDSPNEKFTSEVTCHVPEGMTVLSNGKLISETKDGQGLLAVHWRQDKPHATYLISLVAGYFKKVEDEYHGIPLAFYTPASEIQQAANSFGDTKDALAFFEQEIGIPYPWAKYYQVCVNDFVAGGMENTSITTLTDSTLFTDQTENIRSSDGLMSHELAHQWFGDLVTCKDWSHVWLNEGFATYYAHLYDAHKNGRDSMLYGLYQSAAGITGRTDDTKAIVQREYNSPDEQFSYLAYPKGGWVLHMLRSQLGEALYRRCIRTYLERHQYGTVVTEDLNAVIEELSGRSYDRFFDQWVYHAHHPELEINYSWDERGKLAKLAISQNQKLSESVLLFQFPLTIRFKVGGENLDRSVTVKDQSEDFYFALPAAPKLVRVDPNYTLLAKIKFNVPEAMLSEELADKSDVIGRLLAIEQLANKKDKASVDRLKTVLNNDPFYGVRIEAAHALRSIHSDEAFAALQDALAQKDARVRQQVLESISGFYRADTYPILEKAAGREKNPDILAPAIRALGAYEKPKVHEVLVQCLSTESYRNSLADAAISAMRAQDDPAYIEPLQKVLQERQPDFTSSGFGRGLSTLAYLARDQQKKDEVREFIAGFVNAPKRSVQLAAINALGTLSDPKALPVLESFATAQKESPERAAADRAMAAVRAARKPNDEWRDLRNEVLDLKKQNRDLQKQLQDLKKEVEASQVKPTDKTNRKASPGKTR